MTCLNLDAFEVKDASIQMESESDPEMIDISFDPQVDILSMHNQFLGDDSETENEAPSSDDNLLDSELRNVKSSNPEFITTTDDKLAHFRDRWQRRLLKKRNQNPTADNVVEYDQWIEYINDKTALPKTISNKQKQSSNTDLGKDFRSLGISRAIVRAIRDLKWTTPTPVQWKAIPPGFRGRDLLVNAVTGSGKTAAFVIPILDRFLTGALDDDDGGARVLIVTPTRELAAQCMTMTKKLAKYAKVQSALVVGGLSVEDQEAVLRYNGPDIVICTPGRMIDLVRNSHGVSLNDVQILVLDEADRLLDMGFLPELQELVKHIPRERQTMLFSATLSQQVLQLANFSLQSDSVSISVDPTLCFTDTLSQEFIRVHTGQEKYRKAMLLALCLKMFTKRVIVFCRTKKEAHMLRILFGMFDLKARELHGNLTQIQRLNSLNAFRKRECDYLLCTDVAARGLDIVGVETVINIELPTNIKTYIHRVGRTARAGRGGYSVTLVGEGRRKLLKTFVKTATKRGESLKSRTLNAEFVTWIYNMCRDMKTEIGELIKEEQLERDLRISKKKLTKSEKILKHGDEMTEKPQRTWIMNDIERKELRKMSHYNDLGQDYALELKGRIKKRVEMIQERKRKKNENETDRLRRKAKSNSLTIVEREKLARNIKKKKESKSKEKQLKFARIVAQESMSAKKRKARGEKKGQEEEEKSKEDVKIKYRRYKFHETRANRIDKISRKEYGKSMNISQTRQKQLKKRVTKNVKRKSQYFRR